MSREEPILLTMAQAAKVLAIGRSKLYLLVRSGEIGVTRVGRATRISRATLEEFVRHNTKPARSPEKD